MHRCTNAKHEKAHSLSTGEQGIADEIISPFLEEVVLNGDSMTTSMKWFFNGNFHPWILTYVLMRDPSPDILAWAKAIINMFPESRESKTHVVF